MKLKIGFVNGNGYFSERSPVQEIGLTLEVPFESGAAKIGENTVLIENGCFPVTVGQVKMAGTDISLKERRGEETVRHPCEGRRVCRACEAWQTSKLPDMSKQEA